MTEGLSPRNPNEGKKTYSIIHWQTGKPTKEGRYIVTLEDGTVSVDLLLPSYERGWLFNEGFIVAWYFVSDIEPYKEDKQ